VILATLKNMADISSMNLHVEVFCVVTPYSVLW